MRIPLIALALFGTLAAGCTDSEPGAGAAIVSKPPTTRTETSDSLARSETEGLDQSRADTAARPEPLTDQPSAEGVITAPATDPDEIGEKGAGPSLAPAETETTDSDAPTGPGTPAIDSDPASEVKASRPSYRRGEDPEYAESRGWPVDSPEPLPGAILPDNRIIAYYGNPLSRRMGVLGEYDTDEMLERLDSTVARWAEADPETPVVPALHLIAVVAQADSGPSGKYRLRMRDSLIEQVSEWAETRDALVFLDIQVGLSTLEEELPRLLPFLKRPNFHLGIDPEFSMKDGSRPGKRIGTFDATDIDYATGLLAELVREYNLPPKVLVVHRFTRRMVTNSEKIQLRPEVQIVMHMDGWGAAWLKRDSYHQFIVREPVQFAGFKIFYHNDVREKGWHLMQPEEVLRLRPIPVYIQYQ